MEIEVKESLNLEDGKHTGIIEKVEYREEPFNYTDIFIKEQETGFIIKHGCPTLISEKTKLGKLLEQFTKLEIGTKLDPEKVLVGKEVTFMTIMKKGKDGNEYNNVVDGSVKPLVTTETVNPI